MAKDRLRSAALRSTCVLLAALVACAAGVLPSVAAPTVADSLHDRMRAHIRLLTSREAEGRGAGSAGLEEAAGYIAEVLQWAGVTPAGDEGAWYQVFTPTPEQVAPGATPAAGKAWGGFALKNVLGVLPGELPEELPGEPRGESRGESPQARCIVIGAHYDHLGLTGEGEHYPGADDNASGVALLLELAGRLASQGPLRNTIVFAAFTGEEVGLLGSRHYVSAPVCPLDRTLAMINLDTVGRMERRTLYIFGAGTAEEFAPVLRDINIGFDLDLRLASAGPFASDQAPFAEKEIPVLHFFTGANEDYHRTSDTEDRISYEGLADLLGFLEETVLWLAGRADPLPYVTPAAAPSVASGPPRRASLGTVPDFSRESGGVLLDGVTQGSPAETAGLRRGDVILALGGREVDVLADYSDALKAHAPGDTVEVVFRRGDEEIRLRIGLVERR